MMSFQKAGMSALAAMAYIMGKSIYAFKASSPLTTIQLPDDSIIRNEYWGKGI